VILRYIFSGSWAHCWLEGGANSIRTVSVEIADRPTISAGFDNPSPVR
jgi:hypothetical protein